MAIDVVLFDLGGVLVELGGIQEFAGLAKEPREDEIWRRWLSCPWVRRFERGQCDAFAFARGMVDEWSLPLEPDAFLEAFAGWPKGLLPGARELVTDTRGRAAVACLSNTNALHVQREWSDRGVLALFDAHFLSHEMGLVKPDREAFLHVVERLDRPADRILFLDDNAINVEGARAAGLRAERAVGVEGARAVLAAHGLG